VSFRVTQIARRENWAIYEFSRDGEAVSYKIQVYRTTEGFRTFQVLERRIEDSFFSQTDFLPEAMVPFILQFLAGEPVTFGGPWGGRSSDYAALVQMIEEESESSGVALGSYRTFEGDWYEPSQVGWSEEAYRGVAMSEGYFFTAEEVQFRLRLGMRFTQAEITQAVLEVLSRRFGASLGVR